MSALRCGRCRSGTWLPVSELQTVSLAQTYRQIALRVPSASTGPPTRSERIRRWCSGGPGRPVRPARRVSRTVRTCRRRPVRLRWRKRRWTCPNPDCALRSFIEQDPTIGPQRALLTSRAARWVTIGVGRRGRPVDEVAAELGCGWHTVNNEVGRWGEALLEADTDRIGEVGAVGSTRSVVGAERPVANQGLVHLCRRRGRPPAGST